MGRNKMKRFICTLLNYWMLVVSFTASAADEILLKTFTDPKNDIAVDIYLDKRSIKQRGNLILYDIIHNFSEPREYFSFTWISWRTSVKLYCRGEKRFKITRWQFYSGPMGTGRSVGGPLIKGEPEPIEGGKDSLGLNLVAESC